MSIELEAQIKAYETMQEELEDKWYGQWVLFHNEKFIGNFPTFEEAAQIATDRFDDDPFLLRKVGSGSIQPPVAMMRGYVDAYS